MYSHPTVPNVQYDLCHVALPAQLTEDIGQVDKETDVLKQCEVLSCMLPVLVFCHSVVCMKCNVVLCQHSL